ncbi:hypothetical protein SARC_05102 [Sphaeroforma arctica JP610]|uniref:GRIP domain-containing protein n=1 Tax=Sphaeroforma arctica JP610 TaxID=667725 RepID=A0A0L0G379_9EUKA|nr:hypothetical protein SARC_05102 [Sphaeroforma arctica JP610]KNC82628.1 hypothetical protein SARC_05102 [Sphaeroforma arctica JP610]|eukprot:XP_014156530.1 hypothetical protein SARC_05102 [Sphaeroforma arctica JP610]
MFSNMKKWDPKKLLSDAETYVRASTGATSTGSGGEGRDDNKVQVAQGRNSSTRSPRMVSSPHQTSQSSPSPRLRRDKGRNGESAQNQQQGTPRRKEMDYNAMPRDQLVYELKASQAQFMKYRQRLSDVVNAYKSLQAEHKALQLSFDAMLPTEESSAPGLRDDSVECTVKEEIDVGPVVDIIETPTAIGEVVGHGDDKPAGSVVQNDSASPVVDSSKADTAVVEKSSSDGVKDLGVENDFGNEASSTEVGADSSVVTVTVEQEDGSSSDPTSDKSGKVMDQESNQSQMSTTTGLEAPSADVTVNAEGGRDDEVGREDDGVGQYETLSLNFEKEKDANNKLVATNKAIKDELTIAENKISKLNEKVQTLASSLSIITKEKSAMQRDFQDDKRKLLERSRSSLKHLEARADERTAALGAQLSESIAKRQQEVSERDRRISSLVSERDIMIGQLSSLKNKAQESEQLGKNAVTQLTDRGTKFFDQINQLTNELSETRQKLAEATQQKEALQLSLFMMRKTHEQAVRKQLAGREGDLQALKASAIAERARAEQAASELARIQQTQAMRFESVESEKASLIAQVTEMSVLFEEYDQRRRLAEEESQALQIQINEANDRIDELHTVIDDLSASPADSRGEAHDSGLNDGGDGGVSKATNGLLHHHMNVHGTDGSDRTQATAEEEDRTKASASEAFAEDVSAIGTTDEAGTVEKHSAGSQAPPTNALKRLHSVQDLADLDLTEAEVERIKEKLLTTTQDEIHMLEQELASALYTQAELQKHCETLLGDKTELERIRIRDREVYKQQMLDYQQRTLSIVEEKERELREAKALRRSDSCNRQASSERLSRIPTPDQVRSNSGTVSDMASDAEGAQGGGDGSLLVYRQWGIARDRELRVMLKEKSKLNEKLREAEESNLNLKELIEGLERKLKAIERQDKRENVNIEYLKNIVVKYFSATTGKEHLAQAICMVLQCDPDETAAVMKSVNEGLRLQHGQAVKKWFT